MKGSGIYICICHFYFVTLRAEIKVQEGLVFAREALVASFEELYEASRRHSTIDTYAKKLFLRDETEAFGRLEAFLAFYFIVEQRYEAIRT